MTREPDQRVDNSAAGHNAKRLTPTSVQINMPRQDQDTNAQPVRQIDSIEGMLGRLLDRLDDNDQRYGTALEELNQRLSDLSQRTQNTGTTHDQTSGGSLDRLRDQASQLAAQVNDAGNAHHAQSREMLSNQGHRPRNLANDDHPVTDLGDNRLNTDFANVTQRLEQTLSSHAPAGDLDLITRRLDDLGSRLDVALSRQNDAATLQIIEDQLRNLSAGFGEARQNYARVEAIEENLAQLMSWAHSGAGQQNGNDVARLDSIEQTLHALDRNARDMDARTVSTLEAMNDALHSIASRDGNSHGPAREAAPAAFPDQSDPAPQPEPSRQADQPNDAEPESEVWIEKSVDATYDTGDETDRAAELEAELGASIPDYQPAPGRMPPLKDEPAPRVEPTFDSNNDFIASARRAAAAAAQEPVRNASGDGLSKRLAASLAKSKPDDAGKPRRILYVLAAGLMLTSAGLMYVRMQNQPIDSTSVSVAPDTSPPVALSPQKQVPKPGEQNGTSQNAPAQPVPPAQDKTSERMLQPAPEAVRAPVTRTSEKTPVPAAKPAVLKTGGSVSTATLLASLTPATTNNQMPGVSIEVTEPERTPTRRAKTNGPAALVPNTAPAQGSLALPRRVPAPVTTPIRKTAAIDRSKTDSARANEVTTAPVSSLPTANMPPARIGPNSLRVAAARGNPAAQVEIASRFAKGTGVPQDMKVASEWYGRAAAQGYAPAQYRLAALFERGQGVKKDMNLASTWYRRAAELGNVRAMHNLAVLYTRTEGKGPDYSSARNWFYKAARYGLADSQFNLGILYDSGLGVKKNGAEAYKWFSLAARQGDAEAAKRMEALRPRLPARSLKAVEQTLRKWRAVKPPEEANRSGQPRGGWTNALSGRPVQGAADKATILRAQLLLNKLGYDAGAPDGQLGPQTTAAIRRFQSRTGIARTPGITAEMLKRLEALAG